MKSLKTKLNHMIQWTLTVLSVCLLLIMINLPIYAADSGSCGENVKWSVSGSILELSGNGAMSEFKESTMAPWYGKREEITAVVIEDGITNIGDLAFYGCSKIQNVSIPSSVHTIGEMAFAGCIGLTSVSLNSGLKSIEDNAFARCESLMSIRFPDSLIHIGYQAFYLCSSLTSVRVPFTVSNLEASVFAYCTALRQAVIDCPIQKLPTWTFYGCTSLVDVSLASSITKIGEYAFYECGELENTYHSGSQSDRNEVSDQIQNDVPNFSGATEGDSSNIGSTITNNSNSNSSGDEVETNQETVNTGNASIDITVNHTKPSGGVNGSYDVSIDANIENEDGWDDLIDYAGGYIKYPDRFGNDNVTVENVKVNVNTNGVTALPEKVLKNFAGKKVDLNFNNGAGNTLTVHFEDMSAEDIKSDYDLKFKLTKNEDPTNAQKELIGNAESYIIEFEKSIPFNITVKVPFGIECARQYASIYQKPVLKGWEIKQSVVIDEAGYAFFYLNGVDKETEYMIAINVETVLESDTIVSDNMKDEYGGLTDENGTRYVVTGTKSAWGLSIVHVTLIVLGVMLVSALVVGVIIKVQFNYKKARKQWEEIEK